MLSRRGGAMVLLVMTRIADALSVPLPKLLGDWPVGIQNRPTVTPRVARPAGQENRAHKRPAVCGLAGSHRCQQL